MNFADDGMFVGISTPDRVAAHVKHSLSPVKFPQRIEVVLDFWAGAYSFSPRIGWVGAKTLQFRAPAREGLSDWRRA
jgi:hypothetical protein